MPTRKLLQALSLLLFCLISFATAQLPYIPTHILRNDTLLYVFRPAEGSSAQFEFGSIDVSAKITAAALPYTAIDTTLPFLDTDHPRAFTPVLHGSGNMTVYTGDCQAGIGSAEVWTFTPNMYGQGGNGSWTQRELSFDQDEEEVSAIGPNYLNGGIAFSAVVDGDISDTSAYFFGGMCPFPDENQDWQSGADYSNLMTMLEPSQDGSESEALRYKASASSDRGPPIPEAGFTLTGLTPSYSNLSDGSQTQQQNFVLVGGHTSGAFINMSQVALFALPQQGWTFIPVQQPNSERTDLAIRADIDEVEPRSGHSALLTPDGQRIIVFGGWIGDIETPAIPQLVVLNIGEGYGGTGDWEWNVPITSGDGLADDSSVYGHGAAMLPGGVMMVTGGYTISSANSRLRRANSPLNPRTLFFNISSNTWITEYTPPKEVSSTPMKSGPLATTSQKAGLGVGLGVGMAAVLSLFVFYLWYTRRMKHQRQLREKQLQDLSLAAHRYTLDNYSPGPDARDTTGYFDDPHDAYYFATDPHQRNRGVRRANGHDAERTGLLVEIPSPTRGLRRSLSGRANHHMARYDERRVQGSGNIHPIDELEEEQDQEQQPNQTPEPDHANEHTRLSVQPEMTERASKRGASIFDNAPMLDPFVDGTRSHRGFREQSATVIHSAPVSPIREESHHAPNEWPLATAPSVPRRTSLRSAGRVSPDKSDRTGSTLSEHSVRSNISSNGSIARTLSIRSTAMLNSVNQANPFRTPDPSPTGSRSNGYSGGGWDSPNARTQSFTSVRSSGFPTAAEERESFTTARSSFVQLQAEGEALLGGNPDRARPDTSSTSNGSDPYNHQNSDTTKGGAGMFTAATSVTDTPSRTRKKRWLGSVRRALARSTTTSPGGRTRSLTASTPQPGRYTDDPQLGYPPKGARRNRQTFPSASPRRSVSDAGLLGGKRGKQDWLDDEFDPNDPHQKWRRTSGDDWGAPEDVALAEKERQKREWRERSSALINLVGDGNEQLGIEPTTSRTPMRGRDLGDLDRPVTLSAEDEDWDVEAAAERRVVQVMFTVPKSRLRVVNADVDRASILSLPREKESCNENSGVNDIDNPRSRSDTSTVGGASAGAGSGADASNGNGSRNISPRSSPSPSRVKDLVGRFEQASSSRPSSPALSGHGHTPSGSPTPSIRSMKMRQRQSERSPSKREGFERLAAGGVKMRLPSEDITDFMGGS